MELNIFVIMVLVLRLIGIALLCSIVIPTQVYEIIKNPKRDELTVFRYVLLCMSLSFIVLSVIPFIYSYGRIEGPSELTLQNAASLSNALGIAAMVGLFATLYIVARLERRNKKNNTTPTEVIKKSVSRKNKR